MHFGSALDEVQRLLAGRIAEADHEHRPALPRVAVAELAGVQHVTAGTGELVHARPGRPNGYACASGGDHDVVGAPNAFVCRGFPPAIGTLHPAHALTEVWLEREMLLVALEVLDHLIARRVARPVLGHRQSREAGEALRSVQMQPVVLAAPRPGHGVFAFHDLDGPSAPAKLRRGSQTGRRGTDHERLRCSGHRAKLAAAAGYEEDERVTVRKLPPESHQLRLALVLNGGVSLAIYMYGVTKELHNLARASAALDVNGAKPSGAAGVYYDLLKDASRDHPPISVVVDLIAGTSAGGINGVVLAKALATDLSIDPLESVWFDKGDIGKLILPDTSGVHLPGWGKRIWGAMHRVLEPLEAAGNAVLDVLEDCAPLHGDNMSRWLFQALTAMDKQALEPQLPLVPEGETLELLVTATDMRGYRREISDQITGFLPPDVTFRQVFSFTHGADAPDSSEAGLSAGRARRQRSRREQPPRFRGTGNVKFPRGFPACDGERVRHEPAEGSPDRSRLLCRFVHRRGLSRLSRRGRACPARRARIHRRRRPRQHTVRRRHQVHRREAFCHAGDASHRLRAARPAG